MKSLPGSTEVFERDWLGKLDDLGNPNSSTEVLAAKIGVKLTPADACHVSYGLPKEFEWGANDVINADASSQLHARGGRVNHRLLAQESRGTSAKLDPFSSG